MDQPKHKKIPSFKGLAGKGAYFALAVCIVAIGGLVVAGVTGVMNPPDPIDIAETPTTSPQQAVEHKVTDIPDTRTTTTTRPTTTRTTATPPTQTQAPVDEPLMVLPMGNQLAKAYSDGKAVYSDTMADFRTHDGADFVGKAGDKVVAMAAGKVTVVKEDALWGKMLTIDHGHGITSTYCGVAASVKVGDTVKVGETIGALCDIPCELLTGHHLHLEVAINGDRVNPVDTIGIDVAPVSTTATTTTSKSTTTTKK